MNVKILNPIEVLHVGKLAALLRVRQAERFRARAAGATELELQHLMARVTGNYKRGSERTAARSGPDA